MVSELEHSPKKKNQKTKKKILVRVVLRLMKRCRVEFG